MKNRYLFLLGGNTSLYEAHEAFIEKAGGRDAKIALLITYSANYEKYLPHYEKPWDKLGIKDYSIIMPDKDGYLDNKKVEQTLDQASGIFIGGGHTPAYLCHFAMSPMKELIKEKYESGIPVAGCSAGALISLQQSFISPEEIEGNQIQLFEGIGLLNEVLIGVHYSEENQQPYLNEAMNRLSIKTGYGIDENACVVFKNEKHELNIGNGVHKVEASV
jgi:cyanophycinase